MSWPSINPADLRHKIVFMRPAVVEDISGYSQSWTPAGSAFAAIETTRTSDVIRAGQNVGQRYVTITIRYQAGITSDLRVKGPGGTYVIQEIENVQERNLVLKLSCQELHGGT